MLVEVDELHIDWIRNYSLDVIDGGSDAWFARLGPGGEACCRWSMMLGVERVRHHPLDSRGARWVNLHRRDILSELCADNLVCTIAIGDQVHQSSGGADVMIAKLSSQRCMVRRRPLVQVVWERI